MPEASEPDQRETRRRGEALLTFSEGQEAPELQFERTGHMEDVQRPRAERGGVAAAQFGGLVQGRAPRDVRLLQASWREVRVQIPQCSQRSPRSSSQSRRVSLADNAVGCRRRTRA